MMYKTFSRKHRAQHGCMVCLLLTAYFWLNTVVAQEILFVGEEVPPLIVVDELNRKSGALVELAQALIDSTEIKANIAIIPWARAMEMARNDENVVLLSVLKTEFREAQFQWIGKVHEARAHLIALKHRPEAQVIKLDDAFSLRVGSVRGYGSANYLINKGFKEGTNLVLASNSEQMWGLLFNERVDVVLSNFETSLFEIKSAGFDPLQVKDLVEIPELTHELQFATGHKTSAETVAILTQGLLTLKKNGTYGTIKTRWGLAAD
jgi:polar amino acid transport system substrate-binding protein